MQVNSNLPHQDRSIGSSPIDVPSAEAQAGVSVDPHALYVAYQAKKNADLRMQSGLPVLAPARSAEDGIQAEDVFLDISTCFTEVSTSAYLGDAQLSDAQSQHIDKRQKEWSTASEERDAFLGKIRPHLTPAGAPISEKSKEIVKTRSIELAAHVAGFTQPGDSLLLTGRYGNNQSITGNLLNLSQKVLGKNVQALPPVLRQAFEKGKPGTQAILDGLFAIIAERGDLWQTDPVAKRILALCPEANQADFIKQIQNSITSERAENRAAAFLKSHPHFIPQNLTHDELLNALLPTDENGVYSLIEMLLPPSVAAQFKHAATAPRTGEDVLRPFLSEMYRHVYSQVPNGTEEEIAMAIKGMLQNWQDHKIVKLATYFNKSEDLIPLLIAHWNSLCVAHAAGPEAFFDSIGNLALKLSGSMYADLASLLRAIVDENVEFTLNELLKTLPSDVRELCQDALLSPKGDLCIKCIYRGKHSGEKLYDVEIYATGPLLDAAHFKGKWPIQFKGIRQEQLNPHFFRCVLQHTLGAEERTPFTSSPELVEQFLLSSLGKENLTQEGPLLPNTRPSPQERAFYYSVSTHETSSQNAHHPATLQVLWQHQRLKKLAVQQMQNQEIDGQVVGKLVFETADTAKMMQDAAAQLLNAASSIQGSSPADQSTIKEITALCQEIQYAANETGQRLTEARFKRTIDEPAPLQFPAWLTTGLKPHYTTFKASMDRAQRVLSYLPISKDLRMRIRHRVLEQVFHVKPENLYKIDAALKETFGLEDIPHPESTSGMTHKISTLLHKATESIGHLLVKIHESIRLRICLAIALLPKALSGPLIQIAEHLHKSMEKLISRIRDTIVGALVHLLVHHVINETLMRYGSDFAHYALGSMQPNQSLDLHISANTPDGIHPATDFASGLGLLSYFAPLDQIQVTVKRGEITHLDLPGIQEPLIVYRTQEGILSAGYRDASTGNYWTICEKQQDPKLATFRPYLLLEDEQGKKHVLLRNVLVTDKIVENVCEKTFGESVWNMVRDFVLQTAKKDVVYSCNLSDRGLTSQDPDALLYLMHSHLIRNDEAAAFAAYQEFKKIITEHPERIPLNLAERLLPFALCNGPTATEIRLALFAIAEKQRQESPGMAGKDNALQAVMWGLIAADAMMHDKDDPRFSANEEQTNLLRQAMATRMKQHLPFYTAKDVRAIIAHLLHVEADDLPQEMDLVVRKGREYLTGNIDSIVTQLLPQNPVEAVVAEAADNGYMQRVKNATCNFARKQFPEICHHVQHAKCATLSSAEKQTLESFLMHHPIVAPAYPTPGNLPKEGLTATTIKTHFWEYYDLCSMASLCHDTRADSLKAQIAALQQEVATDPTAAVLVRILAHLVHCGQDGANLLLGEYTLPTLRLVFGKGKPENIKNLLEYFNALLATPAQVSAVTIGAELATSVKDMALGVKKAAAMTYDVTVKTANSVTDATVKVAYLVADQTLTAAETVTDTTLKAIETVEDTTTAVTDGVWSAIGSLFAGRGKKRANRLARKGAQLGQ